MPSVIKLQIEDDKGNIYYPHSSADVIFKNEENLSAIIETINNNLTSHQKTITQMGQKLSDNNFDNAYKEKLDGIQDHANNYTHPSTHPATIIVQDTNHKFCTESEKENFYNAYVDPTQVPFAVDETYLAPRDYSYVVKKNGFVYLHTDGAKKSGTSSNWWFRVGILPTGYRPNGVIYQPAILNQPNYKVSIIKIGTDGVIEVLNESDGNEKVTIDIVFFVGGGTTV